ncbi:MAG: indole-3-glycerol-phosphate synthase [Cyanobacteria bacterium SZAS LIN-3]|nr:indole-3-glycerol-phosphate synthase [Cyanobacteria bacterium SZAS LIN-3]
MPSKLAEIVSNKELEVQARRNGKVDELRAAAFKTPASGAFLAALQKPGTNLICELKPKSPSAGVLKADFKLDAILPHYIARAEAISVLTDEKYFGGSLALLSEVSSKCTLPTLCKDFIIDPLQIYEARLAGAQAVLLIVKILSDELMQKLYSEITDLGMTAVVEVQNDEELRRALKLSPQLILINNRNLDTFEISLATTTNLAPQIPANIVTISASGISNRGEIDSLLPLCHNFLIGSSLMAADNLTAKLAELKGER